MKVLTSPARQHWHRRPRALPGWLQAGVIVILFCQPPPGNSLNPAHCPATVTDASGQTTNYTYNSQGQVTSVTPPVRSGHSAETTTYG
jgi:YD repeat-containing protein